jgi:hypothetical protein
MASMRWMLLLVALSGCGGGDDDGDGADAGGEADGAAEAADASSDASGGGEVTVEDVQRGDATGEVSIAGVVVTALSKDGKHLWVADEAAAAAYGGVYVYRGGGADVLGDDVVVGATVDVSGTVTELDLGDPPAGDTLTEIAGATVSNAVAPAGAPVPLGGEAVATLASIDDGEPFEGVLVQVGGVAVTATNGSLVTLGDGDSAIVMDDDIFSYATPDVGTCYTTVVGIMGLSVVDDERRLLPRQAGDLVLGDAGDCD